MLFVQVTRRSRQAQSIAGVLDQLEGARAVTLVPAVREDHSVASATIPPTALDGLLDELRRLGVPPADITVTRAEVGARIKATPADHRQGGRLAGEVLDAVTALSESSTYAGPSEHDWNRDISPARSGHSTD